MRLAIAIPEAEMRDAPALLRMIRMAPAWEVEGGERGPAYVACFDDFPQSVGLVARMIEGLCAVGDVRITIDARPVMSRAKFLKALLCYRESRDLSDSEAYCARRAAHAGNDGGCPDRACVSQCQFICSRCLAGARERGAAPIPVQVLGIARQAEVDWCPNLRIAGTNA